LIKREHYLSQIRGFYDSDLIKVITGIRRCGKSVILDEIREEISQKTDNIIYLNFENVLTLSSISSGMELISYVNKYRKPGKCYIFLDEIQNIEDWANAVKTLRLEDNSVFISGSNSKLLSHEFLNELSGRFVSFQIRPFVYKEIVEYARELNFVPDVGDYLVWGGFPKRFEFQKKEDQIKYLSEIDSTIIIHDLISRYKIRKEILFRKLVNYVLKSNSRIFSAKSIYDYIKNEYYDCSVNTIMKYIDYLKESFVIEEIPQYSLKAKKNLNYYGKLYDMDVSFNSLRIEGGRYDIDHNLENIIYHELSYMGYKISLFNDNGKKIDFRCEKNNRTYFVQVANSVADEKAYKREFSAFDKLDNRNEKILITTDLIDCSTSTVRHIRLPKFLLMDSLDRR
jgi:uncharacterized protein